jgi:hypothetical protein
MTMKPLGHLSFFATLPSPQAFGSSRYIEKASSVPHRPKIPFYRRNAHLEHLGIPLELTANILSQ